MNVWTVEVQKQMKIFAVLGVEVATLWITTKMNSYIQLRKLLFYSDINMLSHLTGISRSTLMRIARANGTYLGNRTTRMKLEECVEKYLPRPLRDLTEPLNRATPNLTKD